MKSGHCASLECSIKVSHLLELGLWHVPFGHKIVEQVKYSRPLGLLLQRKPEGLFHDLMMHWSAVQIVQAQLGLLLVMWSCILLFHINLESPVSKACCSEVLSSSSFELSSGQGSVIGQPWEKLKDCKQKECILWFWDRQSSEIKKAFGTKQVQIPESDISPLFLWPIHLLLCAQISHGTKLRRNTEGTGRLQACQGLQTLMSLLMLSFMSSKEMLAWPPQHLRIRSAECFALRWASALCKTSMPSSLPTAKSSAFFKPLLRRGHQSSLKQS